MKAPDISENPFQLLPYIAYVNVNALIIANLWNTCYYHGKEIMVELKLERKGNNG